MLLHFEEEIMGVKIITSQKQHQIKSRVKHYTAFLLPTTRESSMVLAVAQKVNMVNLKKERGGMKACASFRIF